MSAQSHTETIVAAIENPQMGSTVVVETTTEESSLGVPSGFSDAEWKAKLQRVAAGMESGICESCES
jgi:hypothetical protein